MVWFFSSVLNGGLIMNRFIQPHDFFETFYVPNETK